MAAAILTILILAGWRFPQSALGQLIERRLVVPFTRWLAQVDRRKVIFILLILFVVLCASEVIAAAGPLDMSMVLLWDVASFIDAAIATAAVASAVRIGNVTRAIAALAGRHVRPRSRRPRTRAARRALPSANDEDGPRWGLHWGPHWANAA